jgi:hypothetical protein
MKSYPFYPNALVPSLIYIRAQFRGHHGAVEIDEQHAVFLLRFKLVFEISGTLGRRENPFDELYPAPVKARIISFGNAGSGPGVNLKLSSLTSRRP